MKDNIKDLRDLRFMSLYLYYKDIEYIKHKYYYEFILQLTEKGYRTKCNNCGVLINGKSIYGKNHHYNYMSTLLSYYSNL